MHDLILPALVCVAAMVAEGLLAGTKANALLRSLKQPSWALPAPVWYLVGLAYYAACFVILYRLHQAGPVINSLAFWLLIAIMTANAAWNWLFFRRRDLRLAYLSYIPYGVLVAALLIVLFQKDQRAAIVFLFYAAYLPYTLAWMHQVTKLNR